jgi:hypothetical protein
MILVAPTVTSINEAISAWNASAEALVGLHFEDGITSIFEVPLEVQIPELEVGPTEPIDAVRVKAESVIQGILA